MSGAFEGDLFEVLFPESDEPQRAAARRVGTFLRLLAQDAEAVRERTGVGLPAARLALERELRAQALVPLETLARLYLGRALGPDTFATWLAVGERAADAWSALDPLRAGHPELPGPPEPGEGARAVARRLLDAARGLQPGAAWRALWEARWTRLAAGPRAGADAHREGLEAHADDDLAMRAEWVAGWVECLLDGGRVGRALAVLDEELGVVSLEPRLMRLAGWTQLLAGREEGARELLAAAPPTEAPLPERLEAAARDHPSWGALLGVRADPPVPAAAPDPSEALDLERVRSELGASAAALLALPRAGASELVEHAAAPALRRRVEAWHADREGACTQLGEPEHQLVTTSQAVRQHRTEAPLRGVLHPERARGLVLEPVCAVDGPPLGWLHLEFEHHALPAPRTLARLAASLRVALAGRSGTPAAPALSARDADVSPDDPRAAWFLDLPRALGMKTGSRRFSGWEQAEAGPRPLALAGGALTGGALAGGALAGGALAGEGPGAEGAGRAGALRRAFACGSPVVFESPDPAQSLHPKAASGVVLPVCLRVAGERRVLGALAVESPRRRDFRRTDLERWVERLAALAPGLRAAQFRAWHRERFQTDVVLDPDPPGAPAPRTAELASLARSRSPLTLTGPVGSGKEVLARWLHFESASREAPLHRFDCRERPGVDVLAELRRACTARRSAGLFVDAPESLSAVAQRWLADRLDERVLREEGGPRLLLAVTPGLEEAQAHGALAPELASRLARLVLEVPALADRRHAIPGLARCLLERIARSEGRDAPRLEDSALALLWRQPWRGNVRQLEALLARLVLLRSGERVDAEDLQALSRRYGPELVKRLASRRPRRPDVLAALEETRKQSGALNKTRAALYLGWDPDTLVARLQELELTE